MLMTDLNTHCPLSYWWGPGQCRLHWFVSNSCTHLHHYWLLVNFPLSWEKWERIVKGLLAHQQNRHNHVYFFHRETYVGGFSSVGKPWGKPGHKIHPQNICSNCTHEILCFFLPLAAALGDASVLEICKPSHRRTTRLMNKAKREMMKAAIPKLSPTVVTWGNGTEL